MKYLFSLLLPLMFLSGCCRYERWIKDVFLQADDCATTLHDLHYQYVRSAHLYHQFRTLAHFDAVWLSRDLCDWFASVNADRNCIETDEVDELKHCACSDHDQATSFYVLSWIKEGYGMLLHEPESRWSVCLEIDDVCYDVCDIKVVDLMPEFICLFGRRLLRFKTAYLVRFDAVVPPGAQRIRLIFNSVSVQGTLQWCLDAEGKPLPVDSINRNRLAYDLPHC